MTDQFDLTMDQLDERASTVSTSASQPAPYAQRPILVPTPPSTKRATKGNRSPSPTRKILALLERATPPILLCQPGNAVVQPEEVVILRRLLVKDRGVGVIPRALASHIQAADPHGFEDIPDTMFNDGETTLTPGLEDLWKQINAVYLDAERCQNHHKDENAWIEVVRSVLKMGDVGNSTDMLEINSVQTQSIDANLLPTLPDTVFPFAKKADLALGFNPHHDQVKSALQHIYRKRPGMALSQMSDAYTSTVVLGCGIEVKESGGDYNEAVVQLGIWCSAGLEKLQSMTSTANLEAPKPLLGWTVIGHEWKLHISWKVEQAGSTVVLGPWTLLTSSTVSYHDLFTLLQLVGKVRTWLCGDYWTWYEESIIRPLCG